MKQPEKLYYWDFKDTKEVWDGWNTTSVPEATADNFNRLLEHYNNLVNVVNLLCDKHGINIEEEED